MAKDFGPIEDDYAFFMAHANEAENDLAEYRRELAGFADGRAGIRFLDFGCGTGEFSERLLEALDWSPQALSLALVEPVTHQRALAARRLARFTARPIADFDTWPVEAGQFDVVLSNHVLYYVDDLDRAVGQLLRAIAAGGILLTAIAPWESALLRLWQAGFAQLGRPVPYFGAEEVAAALQQAGAEFRETQAHFQLAFSDARENRLKILRFLFANYLAELPLDALIGEFDQYREADRIVIPMHSCHFTVRA